MLSNVIKVKLEKNCCSFYELEEFFTNNTFYINGRKGFKNSLVELGITHDKYGTFSSSSFILTLPGEGIPNSFALKILSSLYGQNELALPAILKYLVHRNLSKDFDNISRKLQAKMDQDIQAQNDSETSKEIELCKEDILNALNGGKSLLDNQLKQRYKAYYSLVDSEVEELQAEILRELEDYVNNTNIHKMYKSLNNKIKYCKENNIIPNCALITSMIALGAMFCFVPIIATWISGMGFLKASMYAAIPFLVIETLGLIVAGIAYLTSCYLKYSFTKEMQDYIEEPKYKEMQNHIGRPKCIDKATNTENAEKLKTKEEPVLVVGNLIDLDFDYDKMQPSAAPLSEIKLKTEEKTGELYPLSDLSKSGQQI